MPIFISVNNIIFTGASFASYWLTKLMLVLNKLRFKLILNHQASQCKYNKRV